MVVMDTESYWTEKGQGNKRDKNTRREKFLVHCVKGKLRRKQKGIKSRRNQKESGTLEIANG